MDLCVCESEDHEYGVGVGVNTTLLSDTLQSIGLVESAPPSRAMVWLRKKTHGPVCMRERGVMGGCVVNRSPGGRKKEILFSKSSQYS
jgi:hypothetical protein